MAKTGCTLKYLARGVVTTRDSKSALLAELNEVLPDSVITVLPVNEGYSVELEFDGHCAIQSQQLRTLYRRAGIERGAASTLPVVRQPAAGFIESPLRLMLKPATNKG